jgi:hypothetical protein
VKELQMLIAKAVREMAGSPLCQGWSFKGLSRVMGNYHARFLEGLGLATAPGYPVFGQREDYIPYVLFSELFAIESVLYCLEFQYEIRHEPSSIL